MSDVAKPVGIDDATLGEYLEYLDGLRESGITNMFGAGPFLVKEFSLKPIQARTVLGYWMQTFSERHKDDEGEG